MASLCKIQFSVRCQTNVGQTVHICGNVSQLGEWKPVNSLSLFTDPSIYPFWNPYKVIEVKFGEKLVFKLCIMHEGKVLRWENFLGNRQLIPKSHTSIQITANQPKMQIKTLPEVVKILYRKVNSEILNDYVSDGSSSKKYWNEKKGSDEDTMLYISLATQMKMFYESQQQSIIGASNSKQGFMYESYFQNIRQNIKNSVKQSQMAQKKCRECHTYVITEINQKNSHILTQSSLPYNTSMIPHSELQKYIIHNSRVPLIFQIWDSVSVQQNPNEDLIGTLQKVEKILIAETKLLHESDYSLEFYITIRTDSIMTEELVLEILRMRVCLVMFGSHQIMSHFVDILCSLKYFCWISAEDQVSVKLQNLAVLTLKVLDNKHKTYPSEEGVDSMNFFVEEQKQLIFRDFYRLQNLYSKSIEFNDQLRDESAFISVRKYQKIILSVYADSIMKVDIKVITELINLSARANFAVYLLSRDQSFQKVKSILPVSKANKITALSLDSGRIYGNDESESEVFQHLLVDKATYQNIVKEIAERARIGVKNFTKKSDFLFCIQFQPGHLGLLVKEHLKKVIEKHNKESVFKITWTLRNDSEMEISPFCISGSFYLMSIYSTLKRLYTDQRALIVNLDFSEWSDLFQETHHLIAEQLHQKTEAEIRNYKILDLPEQSLDSKTSIPLTGVFCSEIVNSEQISQMLEYINEQFIVGSSIREAESQNHVVISPKNTRSSFRGNKENSKVDLSLSRSSMSPRVVFSRWKGEDDE